MCQNIEGEKDMRNEEYLCIIKIKEKLCISLALVLHVFSLLMASVIMVDLMIPIIREIINHIIEGVN